MTDRTAKEIARGIALWHGQKMAVNNETIAALAGFGSWARSPELYADQHWTQYTGCADYVLELLTAERQQREALEARVREAESVLQETNVEAGAWKARAEAAEAALATAREDGRKAGLEEAAVLADNYRRACGDEMSVDGVEPHLRYKQRAARTIAAAIRALAASPVPGDGGLAARRLAEAAYIVEHGVHPEGRMSPALPSPPDREGTVVPGEG